VEVVQKHFDYSAMLEFSPDKANFRMPTAEEIKKLGPLWPKVPQGENAAFYFAKAASLIAPVDKIPAGSMSAGQEEGPYAGDVKTFDEWIRLNEPALRALREGLRLDFCQFPIFFETATQRPNAALFLGRIRSLARTAADAGVLQELHGNAAAAADCYLDDLRLGLLTRRNGVLITNLVGIAVESISLNHLNGLIVGGALPADSLRKILERCRASESAPDELAGVWAHESALAKVLMELNKDIPAWQPFAGQVQAYYEAVSKELAARPLAELLQHKIIEEFYQRKLNGFDDSHGTTVSFQRWVFDNGRADLSLRVTEIRAAIALYQQQHTGALPETLDALCPGILVSVPIDPFSGKAMRYANTGAGWKVWSVGTDNIDQGGANIADPEALRKGDLWRGPNFVFVSNIPSNLDRLGAKPSKAKPNSLKEPAYRSERPLCFRLAFGSSHGPFMLGVLDEGDGAGTGYSVAYIDEQMNNDLTSAPPKKFPLLMNPSRLSPWEPKFSFMGPLGEMGKAEYTLDLYSLADIRGAVTPGRAYDFTWSLKAGDWNYSFINAKLRFFGNASDALKEKPTVLGSKWAWEIETRSERGKVFASAALNDDNGNRLSDLTGPNGRLSPMLTLSKDRQKAFQQKMEFG
jgi:hypothetical protein